MNWYVRVSHEFSFGFSFVIQYVFLSSTFVIFYFLYCSVSHLNTKHGSALIVISTWISKRVSHSLEKEKLKENCEGKWDSISFEILWEHL